MAGLIDARTYFRDRLESLGFIEHNDAFNVENIPNSVLDTYYHIQSQSVDQVVHNQRSLGLSVPVSITVFKRGFRNIVEAYDSSFTLAEAILKECMKAQNSKTQDYVKDVQLTNIDFEELTEINDNIVEIRLNFIVTLYLNVNT